MLVQPTVEKLYSLKLTGMAKALEEQLQTQDIDSLSFEERFGLLVDREMTERQNRRLGLRLKKGWCIRKFANCVKGVSHRRISF